MSKYKDSMTRQLALTLGASALLQVKINAELSAKDRQSTDKMRHDYQQVAESAKRAYSILLEMLIELDQDGVEL